MHTIKLHINKLCQLTTLTWKKKPAGRKLHRSINYKIKNHQLLLIFLVYTYTEAIKSLG